LHTWSLRRPVPGAGWLKPNRCGPLECHPRRLVSSGVKSVPFIVYDQRLYLLNAGHNRLGSGTDVDVHLPALSNGCKIGIQVERCGSYAWFMGDAEDVSINGHTIHTNPVPLFDGDELSIEGRTANSTLYFIDDSARYIVRSEEPPPFRPVTSTKPDEPPAKPDEAPTRQSGPLITWILVLALAELLAVLILS
jgi:hypothetical protein